MKVSLKTASWVLVLLIVLTYVLALSAVSLTNVLMLPKGDLATLTFGASSFFLFAFSFVLGLLGFIGYQQIEVRVNNVVQDAVEKVANAKIGGVQNELRGRTFTVMGYLSGEMSLTYGDGTIEIKDQGRLFEAIEYLEHGYSELSLGSDEKAKYMALNNLVFYSLIYSLVDDKISQFKVLLARAEVLMAAGKQNNALNLMLTAAGVFARYAIDEKRRSEVLEMLAKFESNPDLNDKSKKEARYYLHLASLAAISPNLPPTNPA